MDVLFIYSIENLSVIISCDVLFRPEVPSRKVGEYKLL